MTRFLLLLYPASWRERYGDELLELIEHTGLTPRVAADVARAGLAERARAARQAVIGGTSMVFGPAWRHPTAWAVVAAIVLLPTLLAIAISAVAQQQTTSLTGVLESQRLLDLMLVVSPGIAVVLAAVPLFRVSVTRVDGSSEASLTMRLRATNVVVIVIGLAVGAFLVGHIVFESVMRLGN